MSAEDPIPTGQWCTWCTGRTDQPTLIAVIETGSGPGAIQYACPDCMRIYRLRPFDPAMNGCPVYERRRT
ncbi:hypothetical protein ACFYYR_01240 [Streptomyces sp. NPDC001922]|uniref:hypothetical protein n=1 Tax=Streptomyces sp. NPDC001922 TaxID=3364624 RepID=UPI0036C8BA10